VTQLKFSPEKIQNILRDHQLGLSVAKILEKHRDLPSTESQPADDAAADGSTLSALLEENRELKQLVGELLLEMQAQSHHSSADEREPVSSVLNRSRIIPAIRGPEYINAAIASPSAIVWLLYGTPLTLPEIVRQVRSAGKLPIANLDLLTGFAHDADGIALLAAEGVAGVVSTRQSVLRAARAQGIIAVQRTFVVDSIAVGNITRALQHFLPDAVELLPAAAAPLCVSALHAAQPTLPVIATGLVTSMRQVDDLIRCGVSSVATSDISLWVL
jgi:glycerol uptake operon antiterminator